MTSATTTQIPDVDRENPWPGLSSFTEETRALFYGRDRETDELARLVRRETLTVLFGQSGLGKSSLLQAGLFPLLRETDHLPLYLRLDHSLGESRAADWNIENRESKIENPPALAEQVKAALNAAFAATKADAPAIGPDETLWEYFHRKDVDIWSAKNRLLTPVLAFDQFEEIFTLGRADEARRDQSRAFLAEIADLVENRPPAALREKFDRGEADPTRYNYDKPSCRVILSLREDFLPDLEGLKQELPALIHNRLRLKRLNGAQALEAVLRPAPHLIADGVGEKIVEFVAGARGGSAERLLEMEVEPALLSVICRELNDRRRALGQSQITADLVSGNRREILTDFYERSVGDLPEPMRGFIEDHLLTKSGFRDNLALETALEFPGVTRPLIDTLVARRLLRVEDRLGVQRVELTHDVLADVVKASRDARQQRLALEEAAARERAAQEDAARRVRRMRFAIGGLVAVVVALSVGAVFGIRAQRLAAKQASQTDMAFGSRLLEERNFREGLAYLIRAGTKDPGNQVIAPRLLTALTARNFALPKGSPLALPSPAFWLAMTPDGRWIFAQGEDRVVRVINAVTWNLERELGFGQQVRRGGVITASGDPSVFAVVLTDGSIVVCDVQTCLPRLPPIVAPEGAGAQIANIALSPNGRWVAANGPTTVWVWDASTGKLSTTLPNDSGYYRQLVFSPDSQRIVTTHGERITQMWSVLDGQPVGKPIRTSNYVFVTRFSGDGRRLLIWHFRGVTVFDAASGDPVRPVLPINPGSTESVWLTPDGTRVVYTGSDRSVNVIDLATGKPAYPPLAHGGLVLRLEFIRDGQALFTNSIDGLFRLWDLATGKLLAEPTWKQDKFTPAICSPDGGTIAVFSTAGPAHRLRLGRGAAAPLVLPRAPATTLFVNFMPDSPARLCWLTPTESKVFDVASGRQADGGFAFPLPIPGNGGSMRSGYGDTLEPGQIVIPRVARGDYRAWTWGRRGITNDVAMQDVPARVLSFVLNPRGNLAVGFGSEDGRSVGIWNVRTGARLKTLRMDGAVAGMLLSPDEKRVGIRTAPDQVIHIFDIASGSEISSLRLSGRSQLAGFYFLRDGEHILTGDTWGAVHVWHVGTGKLLHSRSVHRTTVTRFELSPDGQHYASLSTDGSVQVWEARSHQPMGELLSLSGRATRASFSSLGGQLATPSRGATARVWDVRSGLPLNEPMEHPGESVAITAYSPDGRFISTTTDSNAAGLRLNTLWPAPPLARGATPKWLLRLATVAAGCTLTPEGKLVSTAEEFGRFTELEREIAALPESDTYAAWARWFLSDDPNRSIAPGFTITPAEAKELHDRFLRDATHTGGVAGIAPASAP